MRSFYYSKLLLFGEHTVNLGSQALAMPLEQFKAQWAFSDDHSKQLEMINFAQFLQEQQAKKDAIYCLDTQKFINDLKNGLFFDSDVKTGYGAGSSGMLCAAIYDRYGLEKLEGKWNELDHLRKIFAQMESFFHGKSSGTDPLICYLNEPLLITSQGTTTVSLPMYLGEENAVFLLDTNINRKAEVLIQWFINQSQNADFQKLIKEELVPANNSAIGAFLEGHWTNLIKSAHEISSFQLKYLLRLIPKEFISIWEDGLTSSHYRLKVCGAGGGGFILGISNNFAATKQELSDFNLIRVL